MLVCMLVVALALGATAANAALTLRSAGETVAETAVAIGEFFGSPDAAGTHLLLGREAFGTGLSVSYRLFGTSWLYLDVGAPVNTETGAVNGVAGISLNAPGRVGLARAFVGVAKTPKDYGGANVGLLQSKHITVYAGIRQVL
jgi:hypothetical protein